MRMPAFVSAAVWISSSVAFAQYQPGVNNNVTLLGHLHQHQRYSNLWGYTDTQGREYALLGTELGLAIVDITEPRNPVEVQFVPGPGPTSWREIKTHLTYAYVVSERTTPNEHAGIQIINLSLLPDSIWFFYSMTWPGVSSFNARAHTISIDDAGFLYIQGGTATLGTGGDQGGVRIFNLSDPLSPIPTGYYSERYVHDSFARNNILFNSNISDGGHVDVLDITDRANPRLLTSIIYPGGFAHNAGTTEDGNYLLTTDETAGGTLKVWDIRVLWDNDPNNDGDIGLVATYIGDPAQIAHNVHVRGDHAYLSHYVEGVKVLDITNPSDPVEVAYYDTYPPRADGFSGAWGVFPYFPSRRFIVSDIQTGLYVFQFDTTGAGGLQGVVANRETGTPVSGAEMHFIEANKQIQTANDGAYRLRTNSGAHTIAISKIGFISASFSVEVPASPQNQTMNFALQPENAVIAVDVDTIEAAAAPGAIRQSHFLIRNTGTGTLRFSIRDMLGPGSAHRVEQTPPKPFWNLIERMRHGLPMHKADLPSSLASEFVKIISDPQGDAQQGGQPDLVGVLVDKSPASLTIKVKFAHPVEADSEFVSLVMDTDQDAQTGENSVEGVFVNDVGPEYTVILAVPAIPELSTPANSLIIFDNHTGEVTTALPGGLVVGTDSSITTTINLALLGSDDGNINVVAGAYRFAQTINFHASSFDPAPDQGHGTIGVDRNADAPWLSVSPDSGVVPSMGTQDVTVRFDATNLEVGRYSALLIVNSNDQNRFELVIPVQLEVSPEVAVEAEPHSPRAFELSQNRPNPFRGSTDIAFNLPQEIETELSIYNLRGQLVRRLVGGRQMAGRQVIRWDAVDDKGNAVAAGVYLYVLRTPAQTHSRKLVVLK